MLRLMIVALCFVSAPSWARATLKGLLDVGTPSDFAVSTRVDGYRGFLGGTAKAFPHATFASVGGAAAKAPAARSAACPPAASCPPATICAPCAACPSCPAVSASTGRTLDEMQAEWRMLDAKRPSFGGIGLMVAGASMFIAGLVIAAALPGVFASALGAYTWAFTIFHVAGAIFAGIGGVLVVWGAISLVLSILERNRYQESMNDLDQAIEAKKQSLKGSEPSAWVPSAPLLKVASF